MVDDHELEARRIDAEIEIKTKEYALAVRQFELAVAEFEHHKSQERRGGLKAIFSPTGVVVLAAALGLVGTAIGKWFDNAINRRQVETSVILKASDVPSTLPPEAQVTQRARNLLWFSEAGYINLPSRFTDELRKSAKLGKGAAIPSPIIAASDIFNASVTDKIAPLVNAPAPQMISAIEGFSPKKYKEGYFEYIGFGHPLSSKELSSGVISINGKSISLASPMSHQDVWLIFLSDVKPICAKIDTFVKVPLSGAQRYALTSYIYDVGFFRIKDSDFLTKLNAGDYDSFAALMRNEATRTKLIPGLVQRRRLELARWERKTQGPSEFCPGR